VLIVLMDMGGEVMEWNFDEITGTLRAQTHGHQPIIIYTNETDNTNREEVL